MADNSYDPWQQMIQGPAPADQTPVATTTPPMASGDLPPQPSAYPASLPQNVSQPQPNVSPTGTPIAQASDQAYQLGSGASPSGQQQDSQTYGIPQPYQGPAQRGGAVKNLLTRMLYGLGQQGLRLTGQPTDYDIQKRQFDQQLQANQQRISLMQEQSQEVQRQYQRTLQPITTPEGYTIYAPPSAAGSIYSAIQRRLGTQTAAETTAGAKLGVAQIQYGPNLPLDPTVAQLAGIPEMAGKPVGQGTLKSITQMLNARGISKTDLGNEGVWLTDRGGNKLVRLGESPGIARTVAGAYARAATTPYEAADAQGNPITISNLQAVQTGIPGIGKPNLQNALQPAALIGDIRTGVQQVRGLTRVLDDPVDRVKIAAALASPSSTLAQLAQSGVLDSLSPQGQDYVIAMMNLRENAMSLRSVLKSGQGSEDVRTAIQRTIPSAATPGSDYANRQLDTATGVLDRVEKGIANLPGVQQAAGGPTTTPPKGAKIRNYKTLGTK